MSSERNKLIDRRNEVAERVNALVAMADRTPEQDAEFDRNTAEFDRLSSEINRLDAAERINGTLSAPSPRNVRPTPAPGGVIVGPRAVAASPIAMIGSEPRIVAALADYVRTGTRFAAAMSLGSDPDGGFEVPIELDRDLQTVAANMSPLLSLCKVADGVTDGYRCNVSTTLPASAWKAEGDVRAITASPTLAQIVPQRGGVAAVVQASQWVMQDASHDLYSFLVSELGRQFGAAIGAAIISGVNAGPHPKGITVQTTAATADGARAFGTLEHVVSGGANTAPTLDKCIDLMSKMHPFYLNDPSCAWLMSPTAAAALMTEKAAGGGSYQWQPDLSASQPPTLFGKPVYVDPNLPAATTANALSVWLGAWKRAYVVARYGRPILVRDEVTVPGQVKIYSEQRVGGNMVDSSALKAIKTSA